VSRLFVCACPIGNIEDCSYRLIQVLRDVNLILAEDTRPAFSLLKHYDIETPCESFDTVSEGKKVGRMLAKLQKGESLALISECGTPNLSDPGAYLVRRCQEAQIPVSPIPGPSALATLVSVSGTLCNRFLFAGFFPKKKGEAMRIFIANQSLNWAIAFYDSPHRIIANIEWMKTHIECDKMTVAKEMSKTYETFLTGSLDTVSIQLQDIPIKGEWCYILENPQLKPQLQFDRLTDISKSLNLTTKQTLGLSKYLTDLDKPKIKIFLD
jgi:16S rRNA (cytidine1402-2'-O)-methyltransferase